jgi:hypothetical protein
LRRLATESRREAVRADATRFRPWTRAASRNRFADSNDCSEFKTLQTEILEEIFDLARSEKRSRCRALLTALGLSAICGLAESNRSARLIAEGI